MQFAVPQFTDVEDKLIGPLTLKQFLFLLAAGALILFFYSLLKLSIFFYFFAIPTALLGAGVAFGSYNGRSLFLYSGAFLSYISKPQVRIFKRVEPNVVIKIEKKPTNVDTKPKIEEAAESRLKKLAYLLDQKVHEEEELVFK